MILNCVHCEVITYLCPNLISELWGICVGAISIFFTMRVDIFERLCAKKHKKILISYIIFGMFDTALLHDDDDDDSDNGTF